MYLEARKIHLIEEVLKLDNESVILEIESIFNKINNKTEKKLSIHDFVGIISKSEAEEIKQAIADTCEVIDKNDWK